MVWQSRTPLKGWRAGRTAIAPVLKTGVRKDLGVRIPRSPQDCVPQEELRDFVLQAPGEMWYFKNTNKRRICVRGKTKQ